MLEVDHTVLLSQWFGAPLPPWMPQFCERIKANPGLEFVLITDQPATHDCTVLNSTLADYLSRAESVGARISGIKSGYESGCLRPLFATMYLDFLGDAPWWGWCDLDIVVGNLATFVDEHVSSHDMVSFWFKVAGEFMLCRNSEAVNGFWKPFAQHLAMPMKFVEHFYSGEVFRADEAGQLKLYRNYIHAHEGECSIENNELTVAGRAIPYMHFRKSKAWPL